SKVMAQQSAVKVEKTDNTPKAADAAPQEKKPQLSYAEQREQQKMQKRARKKVEDAEAEIARLEAAIADAEQQMADGRTDNEILETHASLNKKLENAMSVWELASEEYESLQS
ncbi:MAG: hypothetical protein K2F70_07500, partial [Muribaculaceae bacterium]|nr:hypothetical protein [Muribaculaceae bacterium]